MKKKKFTVTVMRTSYAFRDIEVEADTAEQAEGLALDEAGNHEFSEKTADYSVNGTYPTEPKK